jgi:hypothetical protein
VLHAATQHFSSEKAAHAWAYIQKESENMDSLSRGPVAEVLKRLHQEAEAADAQLAQTYTNEATSEESKATRHEQQDHLSIGDFRSHVEVHAARADGRDDVVVQAWIGAAWIHEALCANVD